MKVQCAILADNNQSMVFDGSVKIAKITNSVRFAIIPTNTRLNIDSIVSFCLVSIDFWLTQDVRRKKSIVEVSFHPLVWFEVLVRFSLLLSA